MAKSASPSLSPSESTATAGAKNFPRTFHGIVLEKGLTVRNLCSKMHVAAESLRAAYDEPGRLSLNAVVALSELVGEDPKAVAADLLAEVVELRQKGPASPAPRRSRSLKVKVAPGQDSGEGD